MQRTWLEPRSIGGVKMEERKAMWLEEMKRYIEMSKRDKEMAHSEADELLCAILMELGYVEIVEAFENVQNGTCKVR